MRLVNVLTIISAISDPFFFFLFSCLCVVVLLVLRDEVVATCKQVRMVEFLFEDIFRVERLDPDGKKFDKGIYVPRSLFSFTRKFQFKILSLSLFECLNFDYSLQICYLGNLGLGLGSSL